MSNPLPPDELPHMNYAPPPSQAALTLSIISVIVGALGCVGWLLPICGCPITLAGVITGIIALRLPKPPERVGMIKTMAIIGISLSSVSLLLAIGNAAWGAYLGATGKMRFHF